MVFYFFFLPFLLYIRAIIRAMSASIPKMIIAMLSAMTLSSIRTVILDDDDDWLSDAVTVMLYSPDSAQL